MRNTGESTEELKYIHYCPQHRTAEFFFSTPWATGKDEVSSIVLVHVPR